MGLFGTPLPLQERKEPVVRTVFNIIATILAVFGFGLAIWGKYPYLGLTFMASALVYGFWELFTSQAAIQRFPTATRITFICALSGVLVWVSWPIIVQFSQLSSSSPVPQHGVSTSDGRAIKRPEQESPAKTRMAPVVSSKGYMDWHNKHNWRGHLKIGMTKTEVRQLFGEAETISASSGLEDWDYGGGWITFVVSKDSPDGEIYSWHEPD